MYYSLGNIIKKGKNAQPAVAAELAFGWSLRLYVLWPRNQYNDPSPAQPANRLNRRPLGGKRNMIEYRVVPHDSIGPVRLGMSRNDVRLALGEPSISEKAEIRWGIPFPDKDYYFDNSFTVNYDKSLNVEFIEVSSNPNYIVTFDGIDVHNSPPKKVITSIRKYSATIKKDDEYPVNQIYIDLDLGIFRENVDEDHINSIGIGIEGYYKQ